MYPLGANVEVPNNFCHINVTPGVVKQHRLGEFLNPSRLVCYLCRANFSLIGVLVVCYWSPLRGQHCLHLLVLWPHNYWPTLSRLVSAFHFQLFQVRKVG